MIDNIVRSVYSYNGQEIGVVYKGITKNKKFEKQYIKEQCLLKFNEYKSYKLKHLHTKIMYGVLF